MFRILTTVALVTSFVAHGLFGCCWHHAHEISETVSTDQSTSSPCKHRHARCHYGTRNVESSQGSKSSPVHEPTGCSEGRCDLVLVQHEDSSDIGPPQWVAFLRVVQSNESVDLLSAPLLLDVGGTKARASLPHCALCQVWVI